MSPSGKYVLTVPIKPATGRSYKSYWHPTITDTNGKLLYVDTAGFPAPFNVYWVWDKNDRAWLYNSDDGRIHCYELMPAGWIKQEYQRDTTGASTRPAPPPELTPQFK